MSHHPYKRNRVIVVNPTVVSHRFAHLWVQKADGLCARCLTEYHGERGPTGEHNADVLAD